MKHETAFAVVITMIIMAIICATLNTFVVIPNAERRAFRVGVEYMLKIDGATNTDTKAIGKDSYLSDAEIDSILKARE